MDYKLAFEILEINPTKYEELTLKSLKKRYRILALKYHPDKNNNTEESNEHFKKINEAYNYLRRDFDSFEFDEEKEEETIDESQTIYLNVLKNFIKSVMDGNYIDIIAKIVNDILNKGKQISLKIFEDLDKDTALNVFIFLSRYKTLLYIRDELLENVKQLVIQKYDNVEIYKLNPSLDDIINNKFYKLYVKEQLFLVPLWHNVSQFDSSGCEIITICEPHLPKGTIIDDDNNIITELDFNLNLDIRDMLSRNIDITISFGYEKFNIPLSELRIQSEQYYYFKGKGLVNIKKDLYDLSDRSDVIFKITLW